MRTTTIAISVVGALLLLTGCTDTSEPVTAVPSTAAASTPGPSAPVSATAAAEPTGPAPVTAEGVTPDPDSPSAAGAVDWSRYDEGLQEVIDDLAADEDCDGLQEQFTAALGSDAGAGSGDLLSYIEDRRQEVGCP